MKNYNNFKRLTKTSLKLKNDGTNSVLYVWYITL